MLALIILGSSITSGKCILISHHVDRPKCQGTRCK